MSENLQIVTQQEVKFYDDELTAVRAADGQIYVSFRHLCQAMDVSRNSQSVKVREHDILSEGYKGGTIIAPPSATGRGGGRQQAKFLRIDLIPLWLATLNAKKVKEEIRPKIKQYQREAAKVLWEAFQERRLTIDPTFSELLERDTEAVQSYKMLQALLKMARQQILIEARLETQAGRLDEHEQRLEALETAVSRPNRNISESQASQISQTVKAVAMALGKKSGRNEYGGVYGELYRRYSISSYKLLPLSKFDDAMAWLNEWHQATIGDEPF